ncbi:NAD(P)H-binding protein [Spirobacillus cienkowskii]|uniref:NAD(P)H-binding protein n=1 Tax=Spirobacillus cienkowskii TaxID=495820 RepID=UPI0030D5A08C
MKNVVLVGASGLLGSHVLALLTKNPDLKITCLVRNQNLEKTTDNVNEVIFDFDNFNEYKKIGCEIPCDMFFCCIGTTLKKAKNFEAFIKVDKDYPINFIENIKKNSPNTLFIFISSIGVSNPTGYYLTAKCEVEKSLTKSLLPYIIVRPSILLGKRKNIRIAETIGAFFLKKVDAITKKFNISDSFSFSKYAPIEANKLAETMVHHALNFDKASPGIILEGDSLTL